MKYFKFCKNIYNQSTESNQLVREIKSISIKVIKNENYFPILFYFNKKNNNISNNSHKFK